jgi:hypothetical protein
MFKMVATELAPFAAKINIKLNYAYGASSVATTLLVYQNKTKSRGVILKWKRSNSLKLFDRFDFKIFSPILLYKLLQM